MLSIRLKEIMRVYDIYWRFLCYSFKRVCFLLVSRIFIQVLISRHMYHVEMTTQITRMSRWFKVCCITLFFSQICGAARDLQAHPVVLGKKC